MAELILCAACRDLVSLIPGKQRRCLCGKSGGRYLADGLEAVVDGDCIVIGLNSDDLLAALDLRDLDVGRTEIEASVIPEDARTISRYPRRPSRAAPSGLDMQGQAEAWLRRVPDLPA
jgi:hypothetical protein